MADKKMIDVMRTWINERKATEEINEQAKAVAQEIMRQSVIVKLYVFLVMEDRRLILNTERLNGMYI